MPGEAVCHQGMDVYDELTLHFPFSPRSLAQLQRREEHRRGEEGEERERDRGRSMKNINDLGYLLYQSLGIVLR